VVLAVLVEVQTPNLGLINEGFGIMSQPNLWLIKEGFGREGQPVNTSGGNQLKMNLYLIASSQTLSWIALNLIVKIYTF
jgi:hypothetical protein